MNTELPKLAIGTWLMGGTKDPDPDNDDAKDIAIIRTALDAGITLIDTAQNYASGKCEELVGQAIRGYSRDSYQILTKQNRLKLTFDEVIDGCKESIHRLEVDYMDYFVCHAPNEDADMREFFKAANQLCEEGLIRHVGVSNFGPQALQLAIESSNMPIAVNQVSFSVNDSDIISSGTYDFCIEHNIPIQAYRPLIDIDKEPDVVQLLTSIGAKLDLSPQQVAIAYLNSYQAMHFTVRASSPQHWSELKDTLGVQLSDANVASIKELHMKKQGSFNHFLRM